LSGGRVAVFASGGVLEGSAETVSVVVELSRDAHRGVRRDPIAAAGLAADLDRDVKAEASMRHGIRLFQLVVVSPGKIPARPVERLGGQRLARRSWPAN
jgi:hypothetical protein